MGRSPSAEAGMIAGGPRSLSPGAALPKRLVQAVRRVVPEYEVIAVGADGDGRVADDTGDVGPGDAVKDGADHGCCRHVGRTGPGRLTKKGPLARE